MGEWRSFAVRVRGKESFLKKLLWLAWERALVEAGGKEEKREIE